MGDDQTFFSALLDDLQRYDVVCCLENMCSLSFCSSSLLQRLYEAKLYVDRQTRWQVKQSLCLLPRYRACAYHPARMREYVKILGDRMTTLHINDNNGQNDLHQMPYTGVGDWDRFLEALKEINYQGVLNFESFGPYPEPLWEAAIHFQGEIGKAFANKLKA